MEFDCPVCQNTGSVFRYLRCPVQGQPDPSCLPCPRCQAVDPAMGVDAEEGAFSRGSAPGSIIAVVTPDGAGGFNWN